VAMTGFQRKNLSVEFLDDLLTKSFNGDKEIDFINTSLRSGLDIYKYGGHVTKTYRDQRFRLFNDGRRCIIIPNHLVNDVYDGTLDWDATNSLFDSKPVEDISQSRLYRSVISLNKTDLYSRRCTVKTTDTVYKEYKELAYRNFIKAYYSRDHGLDERFGSVKSLKEFIKRYDSSYDPTVNSIIKLKRRKTSLGMVPPIKEVLDFVDYVEKEFPNFNRETFLSVKRP
jgi:hypothetical protein